MSSGEGGRAERASTSWGANLVEECLAGGLHGISGSSSGGRLHAVHVASAASSLAKAAQRRLAGSTGAWGCVPCALPLRAFFFFCGFAKRTELPRHWAAQNRVSDNARPPHTPPHTPCARIAFPHCSTVTMPKSKRAKMGMGCARCEGGHCDPTRSLGVRSASVQDSDQGPGGEEHLGGAHPRCGGHVQARVRVQLSQHEDLQVQGCARRDEGWQVRGGCCMRRAAMRRAPDAGPPSWPAQVLLGQKQGHAACAGQVVRG